MEATLRMGVDARRRMGMRRRWALRAAFGGGVLLALMWTGSAGASVLYRCAGAGGETAYVSSTKGYAACVKIGQWGTAAARPIRVAERSESPHEDRHRATVLPGKPPQPVKANPAVLKITPLGDTHSVAQPPAVADRAWEPLPVAALNQLGAWILPRVLDVPAAPVEDDRPEPVPAPRAPAKSSEPATTPIPLQVNTEKPVPPRRGAVYRVVQKNGTVLYTNIASLAHGQNAKTLFTYIVECYACNVHSRVDWDTVPLHLAAYRDDVRSAVRLTGVDGALLRAVIHAESGFNPRALSYKGAQGLMQLMPGTAFELGVGNAFDPAENISGGARYLAMLLRTYHGDVKLAAAAYNAGAGAVAKYGGVPPYAETQVYVKRVALLYQRYRKALASAATPTLATARVE